MNGVLIMRKCDKIQNAAKEYSKKASGKLGFGYYDLETGESAFLNENAVFPTASVFKVFVLAELFRQLDKGMCSLEDRYELKDTVKVNGSGILITLKEGMKLTLYDYAMLMMIISDNTAADFLFNFTGRDNIKKNVLDALELNDTKVDLTCQRLLSQYGEFDPGKSWSENLDKFFSTDYRNTDWYLCKTEENDQTSPRDMVRMLKAVATGEWSSQSACDGMLDIMKNCQTNSRIPKYLPYGVAVAHKTGTVNRVGNDVGIVYTAKGSYILTLFYNGNTASKEEYWGANKQGHFGDELLAKLSREVYDVYVETDAGVPLLSAL